MSSIHHELLPLGVKRNATGVFSPGSSGSRLATTSIGGAGAHFELGAAEPIRSDRTLPPASSNRTSTSRRDSDSNVVSWLFMKKRVARWPTLTHMARVVAVLPAGR